MECLVSKADELIRRFKKLKRQKTISDKSFLSGLRELCEMWKSKEASIFSIEQLEENGKEEIKSIIKFLWNCSGKEKQSINRIKKALKTLKQFLHEEVIPNLKQEPLLCGWGLKLFEEKTNYSAYKFLGTIFKKTKNEILIMDSYVNEDTLRYLSGTSKKVSFRILTENVRGKFKRDFKIFKRQYNIEVRMARIHDRYIVVDNCAFICGNSLYGIGSKVTAVVFLPQRESKEIMNLFEKLWKKGKKLK